MTAETITRRGGRARTVTGEKLLAARLMLGAGVSVSAAARALGVSRQALYRALASEEAAGALPTAPVSIPLRHGF